jgi:hypothetical protein
MVIKVNVMVNRCYLALFLVIALAMLMSVSVAAAPAIYTVAYVGDVNDDAYMGAKQGIMEANLQGQFMGVEYSLIALGEKPSANSDLEAYTALLLNVEQQGMDALIKSAQSIPVFSLLPATNARRNNCPDNVLYVVPDTQVRQAAAKWGQEKFQRPLVATAWHADFTKYAARDLNKRYQKNFAQKMTEQAWAGWAAIKILSEAVVRGSGNDAGDLLSYVKYQLTFDGQKGLDMNFNSQRQLRQILLLSSADGELVGEAPWIELSKTIAGVDDSVDQTNSACGKQTMQ